MRSRTGRYECRHHSRPTVVAGANIRQLLGPVAWRAAEPITLRDKLACVWKHSWLPWLPCHKLGRSYGQFGR